MNYDTDQDLVFLENCSSDFLHPLVNLLLRDAQGRVRKGAKLQVSPVYQQHAPNHHLYWREVVEQIVLYDPGSLLGRLVGHRGEYANIVDVVVKKTRIDLMPNLSVDIVEEHLVFSLFFGVLSSLPFGSLQSVAVLFGITENASDFQTFTMAVQRESRSNEGLLPLAALLVAHGAAIYSCGTGYATTVPRGLCEGLDLFEQPVRQKLQGLGLNATLRELVLPMVLQIAFLRRLKQLDMSALHDTVRIPGPSHPRWRELVTGQKIFKLKYFAVKMLLGRLMCRVAADPSERVIRESIGQLYAIYEKNFSSPAAQEDLKNIFQKE